MLVRRGGRVPAVQRACAGGSDRVSSIGVILDPFQAVRCRVFEVGELLAVAVETPTGTADRVMMTTL